MRSRSTAAFRRVPETEFEGGFALGDRVLGRVPQQWSPHTSGAAAEAAIAPARVSPKLAYTLSKARGTWTVPTPGSPALLALVVAGFGALAHEVAPAVVAATWWVSRLALRPRDEATARWRLEVLRAYCAAPAALAVLAVAAAPLRVTLVCLSATGLALASLVADRLTTATGVGGRAAPRILLVGPADQLSQAVARILGDASGRVIGVCVTRSRGGDEDHVASGVAEWPVAELSRRLSEEAPQQVRVVGQDLGDVDLELLCWQAGQVGAAVVFDLALPSIPPYRCSVSVEGGPGLVIRNLRAASVVDRTRTWLDRGAAALLLLLAVPLLLVVGALVRVTSPGPVIFRQTRIGRGGRPFTMLKFRTMTEDAEERLAEILPMNQHGDGVLFKMHDDPRVTSVGRLLRATSLDELPQLFNVLMGDMSLVGPRPALPHEVDRYDARARHRLLVAPGITGLWQVSGRSRLNWEESIRLDLDYVHNWQAGDDARILLRTVRAVLRRDGAY